MFNVLLDTLQYLLIIIDLLFSCECEWIYYLYLNNINYYL